MMIMWPKEKIYKNTTSECQLLFMRPLVVPEPGHPFHMGKLLQKAQDSWAHSKNIWFSASW